MPRLRELRLFVSDLGCHAQRRKKLPTPNCPTCGHLETCQHYLLECKRFTKQRSKLLRDSTPLLAKLDCELSTSSLLGFFDFLGSKAREKDTRSTRKKLLNHTLAFITDFKSPTNRILPNLFPSLVFLILLTFLVVTTLSPI